MIGYTPHIEVYVDGSEVAGAFYSRLIKATIRDEAGQISDQVTMELDDADNAIERPRDKASITIWLGYKETGLIEMGQYELQNIAFKGFYGAGEIVVLQAQGADLKTKLKGEGFEVFKDTTFGGIVTKIAARAGLQPVIDSSLSSIAIAYRARINTSEIDFLTTLGDDFGAVIKPMGNRLVAAPRGAAKSVSGKDLPVIRIEKSDCEAWEITPSGRTQYGKVKASYIDQKTGKREFETAPTGLTGPDSQINEPLPNKATAKKAAQAEAKRLTRNTGDGSFEIMGNPDVQAEATLIAGDTFREGIRGEWRIHAVEHEFSADGYKTKIEVKSKEEKKQENKGS
jgi:uncharacterized protein